MSPPQCQIYLFLTVGVASAFFLATIVFVIAILAKKRKQLKSTATPATSESSISIQPIQKQESEFAYHQNQSYPNRQAQKPSTISSRGRHQSPATTSESESEEISWMPQVMIPATVRQRKRQVNNELLDTFRNGTMPLPSCPSLLNYYGYMVVPTKAASASHSGSIHRKRNKRGKSPRGTLDRNFDPNILLGMDSNDDEDSFRNISVNQKSSHREKYKRRQKKYASRSRSRERVKKRNDPADEHHHLTIDVPPPPPPGHPITKPIQQRHNVYHENVYEVPVESKPVMV